MAEREVPKGYKEEWRYQDGDYTVTRTTHWSAPGCHDGCGILIYTDKDGKLVKVEGDPRNPYNKGRLCMRCLDMVEAVYNPQRILYPMKRAGERGENKWERITWEEAFDTIQSKYNEIVAEDGERAVTTMCGTGRNACWHTSSIGSTSFGTPSSTSGFLSGEACYAPRMMAMGATIGSPSVIDCAQMYEDSFDNPEWKAPNVCIIWGCDPVKSNADGFYGHWIVDLMKQGTKLIVIDPHCTWLGSRAEIYLPVRPGDDLALALAFLNVIIFEDLYDHDFVDKWAYGFDQLAERVSEYTPEWAAPKCLIDPDDIRAAARMYANADTASIHWGVSIDMCKHGISLALAIIDMWILTGNLDKPGSNILPDIGFTNADFKQAFGRLAKESARRGGDGILGYQEYPLRKFQRSGPPSDYILECIESGYPHKIRMAFIDSSNTFVNCSAEATRCYEALKKVEFVVVADPILTPTAVAFADIILPIAMSSEINSVRGWWAPIRAITRSVEPAGEAKSDTQLLLEMGRRFSPEKFPWETDVEILQWLLKQRPKGNWRMASTDWNYLSEHVYEYEEWRYNKFEKGLLREDGQPGFNTPTGRAELYNTTYQMCGLDPMPYYAEPTEGPVNTPDLMEEYPLILTSGKRSFEFFHSENRNQPTMREFHPWPIVEVNPKDAEKYGIKDGEWIWIQNHHGKCKQKAWVTEGCREGVVNAEHGWWYPEREAAEPTLYGAFESNINNLTTMCDIGPVGYGAPYKTQICKIYPVTAENEEYVVTPEEHELSVKSRRYLISGHLHEQ